MFQIDLKGQNVFHKYAWEGDLKEMQNTVSHVQKIKSESFCKECLFEIKTLLLQQAFSFLVFCGLGSLVAIDFNSVKQ